MGKYKDLTGEKYGKLTVICRSDSRRTNGGALKTRWLCKCECGETIVVDTGHLKSGHTKSCGCNLKNRVAHNIEDLTGEKFGRLTVVERATNKGGQVYWNCKCDCGNEKTVRASHLKNGLIVSCGCYRKEQMEKRKPQMIENQTTHGMSKTRLYSIWHTMKERCYNPNATSYSDYGGRNISICEEWQSFKPFYEWAVNNGYTDDLTIDRKDVNGSYCPENCRWATRKEQMNNRRNTHYETYGEMRKILSEWSEELGIDQKKLQNWVYRDKMSIEEIIEKIKAN